MTSYVRLFSGHSLHRTYVVHVLLMSQAIDPSYYMFAPHKIKSISNFDSALKLYVDAYLWNIWTLKNLESYREEAHISVLLCYGSILLKLYTGKVGLASISRVLALSVSVGCFRLKSWFVVNNPGWKQRQMGKDVVVHVVFYCHSMSKLNNY